jgi:predicted porin
MKTLIRALSVMMLLGVCSTNAAAQDSPTTGLVMATPGSVAFIWHVSDSIALRPEIGFSTSTAEPNRDDPTNPESTLTQWNPGFSVLIYLQRWDTARLYVSPRYVYSRASSENSSELGSSESTADSHSIAGSIGAEYALHRRFGVFGEVGINYSHGESPTTVTNSWNHRTAVGAILYF